MALVKKGFEFQNKNNKNLIKDIEKDLLLMDFEAEKKNADFKEFQKTGTDCLKKINRLANNVREQLKENVSAPDKTASEESEEISVSVTEEDGILKLVFDRLPEKRISWLPGTDYNQKPFKDAIQKAMKEKNVSYEEKCVVAFFLYYNKKISACDVDNYDLKGILDWLTVYLFPDDGPAFVSEYISGIQTEGEEHLEVRIFPVSKLNGILF